MSFTATVNVRWGDLDAQGHVNNSVIVDYLQEARVDFFLRGEAGDLLDSGIVVVDHQVEYLVPVHELEPVQVELVVSEVRAARLRVAYVVRQAGRDCARARTTLCPYDFAAGRPRRLNARERALFTAHLDQAEGLRDVGSVALEGRGHRFDVRVRWSDVDRYHHVNNVRFYDYVQEARIAMTTAVDPSMARGIHRSDRRWVVARQDVDFLGQIAHRLEPYQVVTAPVKVGTTSLTLAAEIVDQLDGDRVLGRARTVLVCTNVDGVPQPLSEANRTAMTSRLVS